jgi:hypothetical protein
MERFFHEAGFEIAISPVSDVTGLVTLRQNVWAHANPLFLSLSTEISAFLRQRD